MRHLALFLLLTAACDGTGIDEDTDLGSDTDTNPADGGTEADTDADVDTGDTDTDANVGDPIPSSSLTDRTYVINYDDVTWVAPSGVGLLSDQIPVEYILLHIANADPVAETIDAIGGLGVTAGNGVAQDTCTDTFGFGPQDFTTNPLFNVGPTTLSFPFDGTDFDIENASIEATFVENGDAIVDISIAGRLDTRPFDGLGFGDICGLVALFGDTCTACPDGATECLDVFLTVPRAEADDGIDFAEVPVPGPECN